MNLNLIFDILTSTIFEIPTWLSMLFLPVIGYFCWHNIHDHNSLCELVTILDTNDATIFMPNEAVVNENCTVPTNIMLQIIQGGSINVGKFSIRNTTYQWTVSPAQAGEYFLELLGGGDPGIINPLKVYEDEVLMDIGALGTLAVGEWAYGDNDAHGWNTVYVRIAGTVDPDTKAVDYVEAGYVVTINGLIEAGPYQIFTGTGTVVVNTYPQDEAWWGNPQGVSIVKKPWGFAGKEIQIINPYVPKAETYKGQIHCHTDESDGVDTPAQVMTAYKNAGYDFCSMTDHDILTADPAVGGILYIPGIEETAEGHILSINPASEKPGSGALAASAKMVLDMIIDDGGFPSMAHPNSVTVGWTDLLLEALAGVTSRDGYYAIEIFDHYVGGGVQYAEDKWDAALSKHIRIFGTAGDDCHDVGGGSFDKGWLIVFAESLTIANIVDSLKRGNYYSSTGAELAVTVSGKVITAVADGLSTIEFIGVDGTVLQTTPNVATASYTVNGDEVYVRIKITRDADGLFAWSNALWINQVTTTELSRGGTVRGNLHLPNSDLRFAPTVAPHAPTVATDVGGALTGNYKYKITFVTDIGETELGTQSAIVAPIAQKVLVSAIPLGSPGIVKERNIYRTKAGGSTYWLLTTLTDNTTTTYLDNTADGALGANYTNRNNTTAGQIYVYDVYAGFLGDKDTAFGQNALPALTTGYQNSVFGVGACKVLTTGYQNSAFGHEALNKSVGAAKNSAFGLSALYTLITGVANVALGWAAGYYETGSNKLFIDNATRASQADGRLKALIYGIFNAATASQFLTFNSNVIIRHECTLMTLPNYANDAAAGVGGLTAGDLYTETGTDPLKVCAKT